MTERFDIDFLERVQDRRDREPYETLRQLPEAQGVRLPIHRRTTRCCPRCQKHIPVSSGATVCGRCERSKR